MKPRPSTYAEFLGALALTICFAVGTYSAWQSGSYLALMVMVPLTLLSAWGTLDMARYGTRPATSFEKFEQKLMLRLCLILVGGGGLITVLNWAGYSTAMLLVIFVVLVAVLYTANQLRRRNESLSSYKERVGYKEPE